MGIRSGKLGVSYCSRLSDRRTPFNIRATVLTFCHRLLLMTSSPPQGRPTIWWSNAIFFCGTHLAAAYGVHRRPPTTVPRMILVVTIVLWQLGSFGYAYMRPYYVILRLTDHYKGLLLDTTVCTPIDPSKRRLAYVPYSRWSGLVQFRVR
jgi:hypothetical protein